MRNFYLFEPALQVDTVDLLEEGFINLNEIINNRDENCDYFICNSSIWTCQTQQGVMYEFYSGIVNQELQRLIPVLLQNFHEQESVYTYPDQMDINFPLDCNCFTGFNFSETEIAYERRVVDLETYNTFIIKCLKYGYVNGPEEIKRNLSILFPNFNFTPRALTEYLFWKEQANGLFDRLLELLDDIPLNPFRGGIGETEVLRHVDGRCSKRINLEHRVVYIFGQETTILSCKYHY